MKIICLGKTKHNFLQAGITEYTKRISIYTNIEMDILPDVKLSGSNTIQIVKEQEAETLIKKIPESSYIIALDENGKMSSSINFAKFIQQKLVSSKNIVFVIGGVYGLSEKILKRADLKLSFSRFTFTHQMIRLILLEQIYRAYTIIKGKKYHY